MTIVVLIARLLLAALFAVAGLGKLADQRGTRQTARDFGVPGLLTTPFALLLPVVEIAVAIALLPSVSAVWGAVGALALLVAFLAAITISLARGRRPDCHCFGQIDSGPVGPRTLVRDGILAVLAGFAVAGGIWLHNLSAVAWIGTLSKFQQGGAVLALLALTMIVLEGWAIVELLRRHGSVLLRVERLEAGAAGVPAVAAAETGPGLPVGSPAPAFSLPGLYGETLMLDALRAGGLRVLLAFVSPGCGPCLAFMPELAGWQREGAGTVAVALISSGDVEENRAKAAEYGVTQVLLQRENEVANSYQAWGTPGAVLVQADGTIGSPVAQGADAMRALWARAGSVGGRPALQAIPLVAPVPLVAANGSTPCPHCGQVHPAAPASPVGAERMGTPAPPLRLPDLTGQMVDLEDYRGRETALLFWNTGCGFCQQLLPELKVWENNRPPKAPALLVVSAGGAAENAAQGLASTILLDDGFRAGAAFGAGGTPSAVLVGADGRIASAVGVGGPAVMGILRNEPIPAATGNSNGAAPAPVVRVGDPAPTFALLDLQGKSVALESFRGKRTLLLFWNPGCGFCQAMLDDLRQWELRRTGNNPELLVISTGAAQENRAMGLRSPVLLDSGMSVGALYGAGGTPMGVLVDAEGRVESEVAAGAEAVFVLARGSGQ